jgi:CheY-like chemotaxis protein
VVTAGTGEEALELIEKQDFDILVIDVRLPGKNRASGAERGEGIKAVY